MIKRKKWNKSKFRMREWRTKARIIWENFLLKKGRNADKNDLYYKYFIVYSNNYHCISLPSSLSQINILRSRSPRKLRIHYLRSLTPLDIWFVITISFSRRWWRKIQISPRRHVFPVEWPSPYRRYRSLSFVELNRSTLKLLYSAGHVASYFENRCQILKFPAVIRRRKDSYQLPVKGKLISLFDNLMTPANQVKIVSFEEEIHNITSIIVTNSSLIIFVPSFNRRLGIRP